MIPEVRERPAQEVDDGPGDIPAGTIATPTIGAGEPSLDEVILEPLGDVEIDNQTDLSGSFEELFYFDMAPAGTGDWTGNLLSDVVFPGEIYFVGTFLEDFYDAGAELDLGFVDFFDIFVEAGFTTTFEVF